MTPTDFLTYGAIPCLYKLINKMNGKITKKRMEEDREKKRNREKLEIRFHKFRARNIDKDI